MVQDEEKLRVGITIGDINGIGLEVIMKALDDPDMLKSITAIVYGSNKIGSYHRKHLELNDFKFSGIQDTSEAQTKNANMLNLWDEDVAVKLGEVTAEGGRYAIKSLEQAVEDLASNKIDVLVTAPIHKKSIQAEGFQFPGHTEFLAKYANVEEALMLMVADDLRVGVVTGHIPLKDVAGAISRESILQKIRQMEKSLKGDFGIRKPRIAVLGLNPHAGDGGALGDEEREIITPAIEEARQEEILAFGPYPADGLFGSSNFKNFDGILAMYHDQGLAPFKALTFDQGVNFTAGLPIVRTSPDHGTGFDIAGKNLASAQSMRNAIYLACDVYRFRRMQRELTANVLPTGLQDEVKSRKHSRSKPRDQENPDQE
jgi:4-hydroxythreonine-4-phosphate dehydrogenase